MGTIQCVEGKQIFCVITSVFSVWLDLKCVKLRIIYVLEEPFFPLITFFYLC